MTPKQTFREIQLISKELSSFQLRDVKKHNLEFTLPPHPSGSEVVSFQHCQYVRNLLREIRQLRKTIKPDKVVGFYDRINDLKYNLMLSAKTTSHRSWGQRRDFRSAIEDQIEFSGSLYWLGMKLGHIHPDGRSIVKAKRLGVVKKVAVFEVTYMKKNRSLEDSFLGVMGKEYAFGKTPDKVVANTHKKVSRAVAASLLLSGTNK